MYSHTVTPESFYECNIKLEVQIHTHRRLPRCFRRFGNRWKLHTHTHSWYLTFIRVWMRGKWFCVQDRSHELRSVSDSGQCSQEAVPHQDAEWVFHLNIINCNTTNVTDVVGQNSDRFMVRSRARSTCQVKQHPHLSLSKDLRVVGLLTGEKHPIWRHHLVNVHNISIYPQDRNLGSQHILNNLAQTFMTWKFLIIYMQTTWYC